MKDHTKTMQQLDESIREATIIRNKTRKELAELKEVTERTKVLIAKLDSEYAIKRD
jgi:hypothetical protein